VSVLSIAIAFLALALAPHLIPQLRISSTSGIALWTATLAFRAIVSVSIVLIVIFFLPATDVFTLLTHWCFHAVLPFIASHLGFTGHLLGDAAVIVPALVVAASSISVAFGLWRGARAVRCWLARSSLGPGPSASVIVSDSEVVVVAAGLRDPKVVVSTGALLQLDDAELSAGLEHEWGHIRRNHRLLSMVAEICAGLGRPLPGTKRALAYLKFHLERDADDYAVRRTGDRLALASAICKAAHIGSARTSPAGPALASLAGSGIPQRIHSLLRDPSATRSRLMTLGARALALSLGVSTVGLAAAMPTFGTEGQSNDRATMERTMACD
jgi:hypothetical protein